MKISFYQINTEKEVGSLNIALIADLHGKPYHKILESLKVLNPDIIAIVGDVVDGDNDSYPIPFFQICNNIAPTFYSLGNHERKISDSQIKQISATGVTVLDNTWVKQGKYIIGGMTSPFVTEWRETHKTVLHYALPQIDWLDTFEMQDGFRILLDHHPENYERVTRERNIDLILSGHAHGGQMRIFNKGIYAPHQGFFPKYTSGVYDNRLVVSRGLANNKIIPRVGNPTELVFISIKMQ